MEITPSVLRAMRADFNKSFMNAYGSTPVYYPELCTTIPSTTAQNNYGWMADLPNMREWLGERVMQNLVTHSYTLENKEWELSFSVPRKDIADDNLGQYAEIAAAHGEAARKHPDQLFTTLLTTGHTNTCFDGQYFFDTDHPVALRGPSTDTYSNYESSGRALSAANFNIVRANMRAFTGDSGRNLGVVPDLLVVPPALESTAEEILMADRISTGGTNVNKGKARILVINELDGADTAWYLVASNRRIKPFVFQPREPLKFVAKVNLTDDNVVYEKKFDFMADARYNMGYTLPFLAYKAVA